PTGPRGAINLGEGGRRLLPGRIIGESTPATDPTGLLVPDPGSGPHPPPAGRGQTAGPGAARPRPPRAPARPASRLAGPTGLAGAAPPPARGLPGPAAGRRAVRPGR